jgi:hypothetical protein
MDLSRGLGDVYKRQALGSQYSWVFGGKPSDYTFITF